MIHCPWNAKTNIHVNIKEVKHNGFRWTTITNPGEAEAGYLRDQLHFHPRDVEDCLSPSQRSKVDRYPHYLFLILLFPSYSKDHQIIRSFEIDIFVSLDHLVTVQERNGPVLAELFRLVEMNESSRRQLMAAGPVALLETMLDRLYSTTFPMIDHISLDVKEIEQRLFSGNEKKFLQELLIARRNIAIFRKAMQAHKHVIRKIVTTLASADSFVRLGHHEAAFENLVEHTKEIWDALEIQREEIETLAETNESLISYRLNEIMKKYTTISVMIFAMTLVAALFSIRSHGTPFAGSPNAFWYILGMEIIVAAFLYVFFRRKRWL